MRGEGEGREGREQLALVLDAACMHVVLHFVSLSHISILLQRPLSIQKRLVVNRTGDKTECLHIEFLIAFSKFCSF